MTWETLKGWSNIMAAARQGEGIDDLPALKEHAAVYDLQLESWPSLEAQAAALSR